MKKDFIVETDFISAQELNYYHYKMMKDNSIAKHEEILGTREKLKQLVIDVSNKMVSEMKSDLEFYPWKDPVWRFDVYSKYLVGQVTSKDEAFLVIRSIRKRFAKNGYVVSDVSEMKKPTEKLCIALKYTTFGIEI